MIDFLHFEEQINLKRSSPLQASMEQASLPRFRKLSLSGTSKRHLQEQRAADDSSLRKQNQQWVGLFVISSGKFTDPDSNIWVLNSCRDLFNEEDELNDQECLLTVVKSISQQDSAKETMTSNCDLEWSLSANVLKIQGDKDFSVKYM